MQTSRKNRPFNIVVYGATGFVGQLVARYLADGAELGDGKRIALAGRTKSKLENFRERLAAQFPEVGDWGIVVADATQEESIQAMAADTRVVISTVGPYIKYGEVLVRACAESGTDYVDLCGEVQFMRRTVERYHDRAAETGANIVHACGFDSVPSDIGLFLAHRAAEGEPIAEDNLLVKMSGKLSGGTIASMIGEMEARHNDPEARRIHDDPYSLSPDRNSEPDLGKQPDYGIIRTESIGAPKGYAGAFLMASANTRVVRRSNSLLHHAYGKNLRYSEYSETGPGVSKAMLAGVISGGLWIAREVVSRPKVRRYVEDKITKPGDGPTEQERDAGWFELTHYARTESGRMFTATVASDADPGYKSTCSLLSEAALTLLDIEDAREANNSEVTGGLLHGGVLTPATALGMPYVHRLRRAGFNLRAGKLSRS